MTSTSFKTTLAAGLAAFALAGCGTLFPSYHPQPGQPEQPAEPAARPEAPAADQTPVADMPEEGFGTRYAYYEPARFADLPGWTADRLADSWPAFLESCASLAKKEAWTRLCERARAVPPKDTTAIRQFYEREFYAFQVHNADRTPDGIVTGYYEPVLKGNRTYSRPYVYPVYGTPEDMVYLDIRKVPPSLRKESLAATLDGRNVIPLTNVNTREMRSENLYALELGNAQPDVRDKRVRLRVEGRRIVPYYTRSEIETLGAPYAKVLAWVDNPFALYSMQLQGSGRIQMADGSVLRLGFGEQNGYPVRPPVKAKTKKLRTRGGGDLADDLSTVLSREEVVAELEGGDPDTGDIRTRGFMLANRNAIAKRIQQDIDAAAKAKKPAATKIDDPSYVFFREVRDDITGPIGALGVPLTAGRSIAVDPRTTPLGYPVFLATQQPEGDQELARLTLAQDTGGMIHGAVRADYFWGQGAQAKDQASRMKDSGQMWLLLPKGQKLSAKTAGLVTRGAARTKAPECLIDDPDLCVEGQ